MTFHKLPKKKNLLDTHGSNFLHQLRQHLGPRRTRLDMLLGLVPLALLVLGQVQDQRRVRRVDGSAPVWRAQVIVVDLAAGDGVRVVEGHDAGVWPEHLLVEDLVGAERVLWVGGGWPGDVVLFGVGPARLELACVKRFVSVSDTCCRIRKQEGGQQQQQKKTIPCQKGKYR